MHRKVKMSKLEFQSSKIPGLKIVRDVFQKIPNPKSVRKVLEEC
ncbi:hypothetical protein SAMN02745150_01179 [Brevinema andersonii]|uniref:Uncharacterized protein n=1 Tax=Brevinema andersonii TaxID=34097 RepID=A0A1I1EMD0_BREAD|nr:hypothetical protein SAMN02745150_01179 [Brevinema andersonii]